MYLTSDAESVAPMVFKGVFGLIQLNYIKTFFIAFLTHMTNLLASIYENVYVHFNSSFWPSHKHKSDIKLP